jgi:hypothetical protein
MKSIWHGHPGTSDVVFRNRRLGACAVGNTPVTDAENLTEDGKLRGREVEQIAQGGGVVSRSRRGRRI